MGERVRMMVNGMMATRARGKAVDVDTGEPGRQQDQLGWHLRDAGPWQ